MPRWQVGWTPTGPVLASEWMIYIREAGTTQWMPVGSTRSTSYMLDVAKSSEVHEVGIAPLVNGAEGPEESWAVVSFRPDDTTDLTVPADVTNFSVAQSGNFVVLQWTAVDAFDLDYYEIRQGASWESSVPVYTASGGDTRASFGWRYSGSVKYLIKARTEAGLWSDTAADATVIIEPESYYPAAATYDEHSGGYSGTTSNTEVSSGNLQIASAPATASAWTDLANTYTWVPLFPHKSSGTYVTAAKDAGSLVWEKVEAAITPDLPTTTVYANEWHMVVKPDLDGSGNYTDIGARGTLDKVVADGSELVDGFDVKIEIDTTPDDPAGTPTWDGWRIWVPGALYYYRGVRLRITLTSVWFWNLRLTAFSWRRRKLNRKDDIPVVISTTGGTSVNWTTLFTATPVVVCSPIASTALFAVASSVDTSGCVVRLFDADGVEQASGLIHVHAMGV